MTLRKRIGMTIGAAVLGLAMATGGCVEKEREYMLEAELASCEVGLEVCGEELATYEDALKDCDSVVEDRIGEEDLDKPTVKAPLDAHYYAGDGFKGWDKEFVNYYFTLEKHIGPDKEYMRLFYGINFEGERFAILKLFPESPHVWYGTPHTEINVNLKPTKEGYSREFFNTYTTGLGYCYAKGKDKTLCSKAEKKEALRVFDKYWHSHGADQYVEELNKRIEGEKHKRFNTLKGL